MSAWPGCSATISRLAYWPSTAARRMDLKAKQLDPAEVLYDERGFPYREE